MNGPRYRTELTGLGQPLWARPSLRLHGIVPPNTQMDREGGGRERGRETDESVDRDIEKEKKKQ